MHIPVLFRNTPDKLDIVNPVASVADLTFAHAVREKFLMGRNPDRPYMTDIVRAFRLLKGAGSYLEAGTRDKGNLAWLSSLLAPDALLIDIDIDPQPEQEKKLRAYLPSGQKLLSFVGDSVADSTIAWLKQNLGGRKLKGVFLDSSHMYSHIIRELDLYMPFLDEAGVVLSHDLYWGGNETEKGKSQAFAQLDKVVPVYAVCMNEPVHRFFEREQKTDMWGGVAIIFKADYTAALARKPG